MSAAADAALALDHLVFAAPDLDSAIDAFAERTGVAPVPGGRHGGLGTCNALASLGDGLYLEVIAPDSETKSKKNMGGLLEGLAGIELFTWALRTDDLPGLSERLVRDGHAPSPITETTREEPSGGRLVWDLMGLPGLGGAWPFFIDWRDCPHPSASHPIAGEPVAFEVRLPVPDPAALPFAGAKGLQLREGTPSLSLTLETKAGAVEWTAEAPRGFYG